MWCLQESTCWMLNGRRITLQSGIDYLPLEAKSAYNYYDVILNKISRLCPFDNKKRNNKSLNSNCLQ